MDVRRHGNPDWQQKGSSNEGGPGLTEEPTSYAKAEDDWEKKYVLILF